MELLVGLHHVHHQVLIGLAHTHHGGGGDHIEDQLLGSARLEAGGAGEHLGPNHHLNGQVGRLAHCGAGVAGDSHGAAAQLTGIIQAAQHIGGAAAGGDAHHQIVFGQVVLLQVVPAQVPAVLRALNRLDEGLFAAGNETHHQVGGHAEGGGALGGIQHAQAAAGAGAHIKQPSALFQGVNGPLHRFGNVGQQRLNGLGDSGVLPVHGRHNLQRRHGVQIHGSLIAGLRGHCVQIQIQRPFSFRA